MENSFIYLLEYSIKEHWELPALTDYKGVTYTYKDVARRTAVSEKEIKSPYAAGMPPIGELLFWESSLTERSPYRFYMSSSRTTSITLSTIPKVNYCL